jgi:hypothetical protein
MNMWKTIKNKEVPKLKNPVLVEGLPGIGNVGKVAVDFIIDEIKAVKFCDFFSHSLPHSVFVNEENLVELPTISMYYKKFRNRKSDLLFLAGDVQPTDEKSSYEFCEKVLDIIQNLNTKEIITLGGIGLPSIPKKPRVYCTGNSKDIVKRYLQGAAIEKKLYGVVGPIVGVSGLLLGLAKKRSVDAVSLLAETYSHPMYLGLKGAKEIVKVLNSRLSLKINMQDLDREIEEIEGEITEAAARKKKPSPIQKIQSKLGKDISYIG